MRDGATREKVGWEKDVGGGCGGEGGLSLGAVCDGVLTAMWPEQAGMRRLHVMQVYFAVLQLFRHAKVEFEEVGVTHNDDHFLGTSR